MVQVVFTYPEAEGLPEFRDALYVPLDDYHQWQATGKLATEQQARYDAWKNAILNPPAPEPADVVASVGSVDSARQILTDALAQLDTLPPDTE